MKFIYPSDNPFLSIIIPAHNESNRLPQSLNSIREFVNAQPYSCEVIVVENGSSDNTGKIVRDLLGSWPELQLIELKASGKGLAVREGMLAAKGYYRFMMDADLSMAVEEVNKFLPPRLDVPVAIASREASSRNAVVPFLLARRGAPALSASGVSGPPARNVMRARSG